MSEQFLSIGVMGGATHLEKYRELHQGCCETWVRRCPKVHFFCGDRLDKEFEEEMTTLSCGKALFVHLENVGEDYESAFLKQFLGLVYLMDYKTSKWYVMFGTDNYVRYDRLVETLKKIKIEGPIIVGGTIEQRVLDIQFPFTLGGGGICINHQVLTTILNDWSGDTLSEKCMKLYEDWKKLCHKYKKTWLVPACDVALCYYSWIKDIPIMGVRGFFPIDYKGTKVYTDNFSFNYESIITCHFMTRIQMLEYDFLSFNKKDAARGIIKSNYRRVIATQSDIWEHLPILRQYASRSEKIAEMGVRDIVSTWAFIYGLIGKDNATLYSIDINTPPNIDKVLKYAQGAGVNMKFIKENSILVNLPPSGDLYAVDLLFIDTWHIYGHLKRELNKHHNNVGKYIIMHDTTVDAIHGESIRCNMNINEQAKMSGYPIHEITRGLWPAILEFLEENVEWNLVHRYENCNGLTILQRRHSPTI